MIGLGFGILAVAALLGAALAVLYARQTARPIARVMPTIHGAVGAAGLAVLIAALRHGPSAKAVRMGTAGFGVFAAGLIALALAVGIVIAVGAWRGRRPLGMLIGAHATLAVAGVTLLLAAVALG